MATNDPFEPLTTGSTPGGAAHTPGPGSTGTAGHSGITSPTGTGAGAGAGIGSFDSNTGAGGQRPFNKEVHRRNLHDVQRAISREFQTLISDAESLLKQTTGSASGQSEELRNRINANIERAKGLLKDSESNLRDQGQAARQATEDYLHQHPWQSLGIAAGVGFLLGLLSAPRR